MQRILHPASICVFTQIVEFDYMFQIVFKVVYYQAKTEVLFSGRQHIITLSRVFLPI
jgi:hypothetical protein